jgi:hypothetical protein
MGWQETDFDYNGRSRRNENSPRKNAQRCKDAESAETPQRASRVPALRHEQPLSSKARTSRVGFLFSLSLERFSAYWSKSSAPPKMPVRRGNPPAPLKIPDMERQPAAVFQNMPLRAFFNRTLAPTLPSPKRSNSFLRVAIPTGPGKDNMLFFNDLRTACRMH